MDEQMRKAIEASKRSAVEDQRKREAKRREEEVRRAQQANERKMNQLKIDAVQGGLSEEEALKIAIEESKKEEEARQARRKLEAMELKFSLSAGGGGGGGGRGCGLYNRRKCNEDRKKDAGGEKDEKEYAVPTVEGQLQVKMLQAKELLNCRTLGKPRPYAVVRVMRVAPVGTVKMTIHEGKNLQNTQLLGKQDPYVIMKLDRAKVQTKVHDNGGKSPVWNETLEIKLTGAEKNEETSLEIWNHNLTLDKKIGVAKIDIPDLVENAIRKWYPVQTGSNGEQGEICITTKFEPAGQQQFKELYVEETEVDKDGDITPQWNQELSFNHLESNCYVHVAIWDKSTLMADTLIASSGVISVQGAIHQNHFSGGKFTWYKLSPTKASKKAAEKTQDCNSAGWVQLTIRFVTKSAPYGIKPEPILKVGF